MWMRDHRGGVTALVAKVSGRAYVAYTTDRGGLITMLGDDEVLEVAQLRADQYVRCAQPCSCPPWLEIIARKRAVVPVRDKP